MRRSGTVGLLRIPQYMEPASDDELDSYDARWLGLPPTSAPFAVMAGAAEHALEEALRCVRFPCPEEMVDRIHGLFRSLEANPETCHVIIIESAKRALATWMRVRCDDFAAVVASIAQIMLDPALLQIAKRALGVDPRDSQWCIAGIVRTAETCRRWKGMRKIAKAWGRLR